MLKELTNVRQISGEPHRRWFSADTMDLIVWYDERRTPVGFQFCYDKGSAEKALTWRSGAGFSHSGVDDGEGNSRLTHKSSPILVANGRFNGARVITLLDQYGAAVPSDVRQFVAARINECALGDDPVPAAPSDKH